MALGSEQTYDARGYRAYQFEHTKRGRLPARLEVDAGGLHFVVELVRADISLAPPTPRRRTIRVGDIPAGAYQPPVIDGQRITVPLLKQTCFRYFLFPLNAENRRLFPGYKVPFTVIDGGAHLETRVSSGSKGSVVGSLDGHYFSQNMRYVYRAHPELHETREIVFEVVEPGRVYKVVS